LKKAIALVSDKITRVKVALHPVKPFLEMSLAGTHWVTIFIYDFVAQIMLILHTKTLFYKKEGSTSNDIK